MKKEKHLDYGNAHYSGALIKSVDELIDNFLLSLHSEKSTVRQMLFYSTNYWQQF